MTLGLPSAFWTGLGFLGQGLFTARFLVQWYASEKKRESVVPVSFWWLSVSGSALLVVYAAVLEDPVFILGSLVNGCLYARNLILIHAGRDRAARKRVLVPITLAIAAFVLYSAWSKPDVTAPLPWLIAGFLGTALWTGRFVIQWYASERAGKSLMPVSFWYVGLLGSVLLLSYSVHQRTPVFILGYLFPPVPYIRNLVLIYRKEGAPAPIRWAGGVWRTPRSRVAVLAVFGVLLAVFLAARTMKASDVAGDFLRYHRAGTIVLGGNADHLYDRAPLFDAYPDSRLVERPFRYLPSFAVVAAPLALLPPRAAEVLWSWLNAFDLLMLLAVCWWFCRRYGAGAGWMWIPFFFILRYGWDNLNLGQINPSVILLATAGVYLAETGRPSRGGLLVGLAAGIKLTPLLIVPVLVLRRRWRAAGLALLGFVLVIVVLPSLVLGPARTWRLSRQIVARQGETLVAAEKQADVVGESLKAMCYRVLGTHDLKKHKRRIHVSLNWLDDARAQWAYRGAAAALLAWLAWFSVRRKGDLAAPLVWGATLCAALLVSPESRQAHFLSLALPATALVMVFASRRLPPARERAGMVLFGIAFLLASLPGRAIIGKDVSYFLAGICASGFASLFLLVALGLAGAVERRP